MNSNLVATQKRQDSQLVQHISSWTSEVLKINHLKHYSLNYVVLCVQGGTVDITAHEVLESGVKELHHATGGACGGSYVDKNFENFLVEILGTNFINKLVCFVFFEGYKN